MDKFSMLLSVLAVGLAGFLMIDGRGEADTPATDGGSESALLERLDRIEAELARLRAGGNDMLGSSELRVASGASAPELSGMLGSGENAGSSASAERLARIEQELAETKERLTKVEDPAVRALPSSGSFFSPHGGPRRFFHNADAAAKALELDDRQKQDLAQVIENTQTRLKELYDTPNEDGKTLAEISTLDLGMNDTAPGEMPDLDVTKLMGHVQNIEKFKKGTVPGTRESYRDAEKRIRDEGKAEARGLLNEDQAKKWDNSHTDSMFSSPGAGPTVVTTTSVAGSPIGIGGVMGGEDK